MTGKIHILPDPASLNAAVAQTWLEQSNAAIAERGAFHVALSGGNTPRGLFQLLASPDWRERFDWQHIHLYFGDERFVPPTQPDSNYRMARESMLDQLAIPAENIHPVPTERQEATASAQAYEKALRRCLPVATNGWPVFDVMLQGIGDDGHTASLFPGTAILQERDQWVAAVYVDKLDAWRISVTFPVIDQARCIMFLAAGSGKADILRDVLSQPPGDEPYPVQMIRAQGEMHWYVDSAAAHLLPPELVDQLRS